MRVARTYTVSEVSAGGLVLSKSNPDLVALISHRNRGGGADWVIPKGHVEHGEQLEVTAIREVYEETGLQAQIMEKIGEISYSFKVGPKRIKKTVHHFLLRQTGGELNASGDPTGEVLAVRWFPLDQLEVILSHENERKVAQIARELLD